MATGLQFGDGGPEGNVTASPGSIWSQTDGPIWRKLRDTGTSDEGWIRTDLNVFNIRDYGALCDGTADDHEAWQAAIDAADAVGGMVFHPGGVSLISMPLLPISNSATGFFGAPGSVVKAGTGFPTDTDPIAMLTITGSGAGSRFGAIRDLRFDGAGNAQVGVRFQAVQRQMENVVIENCKSIGLYVPAAQNCTFISCQVERNGGAGESDANCVLDAGAGNNLFLRCQFSPTQNAVTQGFYNLILRQSFSVSGAFAQPEANTFVGCQFERAAESYEGAILQDAGRNNVFISCSINVSPPAEEDPPVRYAVRVRQSGTPASAVLRLINCRLSGDANTSIAIGADVSDGLAVIAENLFLENFDYAFELSDNVYVEVAMPFQVGGAATFLATAAETTRRRDRSSSGHFATMAFPRTPTPHHFSPRKPHHGSMTERIT